MSGFRINRGLPVVVNQVSSPSLSDLPATTVNFDSSGLLYGGGVVNASNYAIVSQSFPSSVTLSGIYVKYSSLPGNMYTGGTLNRFVVSLYKNGAAVVQANVDNSTSSTGPIQTFLPAYVTLQPTDTWAVGVSPSGVGGQAPTSGQNVWWVSLV